MKDQAYHSYDYRVSELPHHYGDGVHLLSDPVLLTQLGRLCRPETLQPEITYLVRDLYESLVRVVMAAELPRRVGELRTRMFSSTPEGVWSGSMIDPHARVVTVGIARAGTQPSQVAFEALTRLVSPDAVRQDHVYMNRVTDEAGAVTGVSLSGSKVGGTVNDAIVLVPDPMGATGSSMLRTARMYFGMEGGPPRRFIAMHLVVTPEYLKAIADSGLDIVVYALRLDRGLSAPEIFKTALGERWPEERGLNERHYIVPGAGGLGEILNNSYV